MRNHTLARGILAAGLGLLMAFGASAKDWEPKRTAAGKPDFNGVWQSIGRHNYNIEPHAARAGLQMREGPLGPVPAKSVVKLGAVASVPASLGIVEGGKIPYTADALKQRNDNAANWIDRDPEVKCYLPGVPRANYMAYPFQIFHNDDALFFAYEYAGAVRNILLKDPGEALTESWMGQSWARWEGDTLVIEATGFNGEQWLDRAGNFISYNTKVTERYTQTGPSTIAYEATLEDDTIYTQPWKIAYTLYRMEGNDAKLMQFKCVEFVEELLYGHLRKVPLD